jgi:Domain of unknown function (DUF3470)
MEEAIDEKADSALGNRADFRVDLMPRFASTPFLALSSDLEKWLKLNAEYALIWPNITTKREPPPDAKEFDGRPNKLESYFSPHPGQGD